LAFGVNFEIEPASGQYCAGFHNPNKNDSASCSLPSIIAISLEWKNNYTVASTYFDDNPAPQIGGVELLPSYGLGPTFFLNLPAGNYHDDFFIGNTVRFIGTEENYGNRWSTGDVIDMFMLDYVNDEVTENPEFVLASATNLAVGSIAVIAAVLM
jgi:hypothetical protein